MAEREIWSDKYGRRFEWTGGEFVPVNEEAEATGAGRAALIGAGRELTRWGRGAQNLAASALGDEQWQQRLQAAEESERPGYEALRRSRPGATMAGELLPGLATIPIGGTAALGIRGAARQGLRAAMAEQGALGALTGAIGYQENAEDQLAAGLGGAALGAGGSVLGETLGRVRQAARAVGDYEQTIRETAERLAAAQANELGAQGTARAVAAGAQETVAEGAEGAADIARQQAGRNLQDMLRVPQIDPALESERLIARADELGIGLTAGDVLQNPSLKQLEASIGSFPLTSAAEQMRKVRNRETVNKIFGRALGLGDDMTEITEAGMGRVLMEVDEEFNAVGQQLKELRADPQLIRDFAEAELKNATNPVRTDKLAAYINNANDLFEQGGGVISGRDAINWRSAFNREMRDAAQRGEGELSARLRDVIDALDDAIVRQGGKDLGKRYAKARARYRLADALAQPGIIRNGNVMTQRAANQMMKRYPMEFARGNSTGARLSPDLEDAFDALRISTNFGDIVGDSGTATRLSLQTLLTDPGGSMTANLLGRGLQMALGRAGSAAASPQGRIALGTLGQESGSAAATAAGVLGRLFGG